ncbi:MAG: protein phosphatase 2C domain-containing protein [Gammaproteobacteria bacterium]|nr:protein phosphatase 2C domain-containing protein [Gammaproteobacteria bacterium]
MSSRTPTFRWWSASASDSGHVRDHNEDAWLDDAANGLWAVADGMGGHSRGEVASQCVIESLQQIGRHPSIAGAVREAQVRLLGANQHLRALTGGDPHTIIGATAAVLITAHNSCACVWAGDSRIYRLRGGDLAQLTQDHSETSYLVQRGEISAEEAETHPDANVLTRAVGGADELDVDTQFYDLADGDRFLICSDGLYREMNASEIATYLRMGSVAQACHFLLRLALSRECSDNVTAVVVEFIRAA